jgi:hypothetical protein
MGYFNRRYQQDAVDEIKDAEPFENIIINHFKQFARVPDDEYPEESYKFEWGSSTDSRGRSYRYRAITYRMLNHQIVKVKFNEKAMLIESTWKFTNETLQFLDKLGIRLSKEHIERHNQELEDWF